MRAQRLKPLSARKSNTEAADYFQQHGIRRLFEDLSMDLALNRPKDPVEYMKDRLVQMSGTNQNGGSAKDNGAGDGNQSDGHYDKASFVRVHIDCSFNGTRRSAHFFRFDQNTRATAMFLWETEAAEELKRVVKEVCGSGAYYALPSTAPASPAAGPVLKDDFPPPPELTHETSKAKGIVEQLVEKWQVLGWEGCNFHDIFCKIDRNGDGLISAEELLALMEELRIPTEGVDVAQVLQELDTNNDGQVNESDVSDIVTERFERQVVSDLMRNLDVAGMLSRRLLESRKRDGHRTLQSVVFMARDHPDSLRALLFGLGAEIAPALQRELKVQHDIFSGTHVPDFSSNNAKFAVNAENVREAGFGDLSWFQAGLDRTIGLPDINILQAMEREHESTETFRSGNYGIETTPRLEWEFVLNPQQGKLYPGEGSQGRRRLGVQEVLKEDEATQAGLSLEEVVALRLYTGPMYRFYNAILRGMLHREDMNTAGYRLDSYVTTIHMINSGVVKLSAWSNLPANRKVYRGQQGVRLPKQFFQEDRFGCRGGVELAFMSTTLKMSVALQYARSGVMPIIFEIDVGQVDRGASLSWLSQFPQEEEVLLPPLSNLEVIGNPQVRVVGKMNVLVCSVRLNVNFRSPVKEELEGRRKLFHMSALHNNVQEIERDLGDRVQQLPKGGEGTVQGEGRNVMQHILSECEEFVGLHGCHPSSWFNSDVAYKQALEEASKLRSMALQKFDYWAEHTEVDNYNINGLSLAQVYRLQTGQFFRQYRTAASPESRRRAAVDLAVWIGEIESDEKKNVCNGMDSETAVIRAAAEGEWQRLNVLVDAGCEIDVRDRRGFTALSSAACNGYMDCMRLLMERKSDLEVRTLQGETPLFLACRYGHQECVEALLGEGADMMCENKQRNSCLMAAAEFGHLHVVQLLSARDPDHRLLHASDTRGWTAVHFAAQQGHVAIVRFLADQGGAALLQKRDKAGRTALHCAARSWRSAQPGAQTEVVQLLEDTRELDVADADKQGRSSLHLACLYGHEPLVSKIAAMRQGEELLQSRDKLGLSCLHLAARGGHLHVAASILKFQGAASLLDARARDGRTCLHWACAIGKRKLVGMLVEESLAILGSDRARDLVLAQRNDGRTVMHYAAVNGHTKVVEKLLQLPQGLRDGLPAALPGGIGRELLLGSDHEGWTCLHWATEGRKGEEESRAANVRIKREQKREVVAFLCEKGGPELYLSKEKTSGLTCMHLACASGLMEMVEVLYDKGKEELLHSEDDRGRSCLHFAAANGRKKVVEFLFEVGGEELLMRQHKDGRTVMHFAAAHGHKKVVDFLSRIPQHGKALVMSRDADSWTTLHWAASLRDEEGEVDREQKEVEAEKKEREKKKLSRKQASERVEVAHLLSKAGGRELVMAAEGMMGQTGLHMASSGGSVEMVEALLQHGGEELLWRLDLKGRTALHSAAASGRWRVAEVLVQRGGDTLLQQRQRDGRTSLMHACSNNHKKCAEWLLARGGEHLLLATDAQGWNCLHWAVQNRRGEAERKATWAYRSAVRVKQEAKKKSALVTALVDRGGRALLTASTRAAAGLTSLHLACGSGETEVVETLLELLTDAATKRDILLARDLNGFTCLHSACRTPIRSSLVRLLVEAGGKELAVQADDAGRTCVHMLCGEDGDEKFAEYETDAEEEEAEEEAMLDEEEDNAEIILADDNEDLDDVDGMLTEEADAIDGNEGIAEDDDEGARLEALEALLQAGLEGALCVDKSGSTPLHAAVKAGRKRLVQSLLKYGGVELVEARDSDGKTALEVAMDEGKEEVVEMLMQVKT